MTTTTNKSNGGEPHTFAEFNQQLQHGRGRGLSSIADALARVQPAAPLARTGWGERRPLSRAELVAAWYAGEPDPLGAAAVAVAEQTADDVRLVANVLRAIVTKIEDNGGNITETMKEEARGAGLLAVVEYRNGVRPAPVVPGARVSDAVAVVAWRAVSDELSRDDKGHAVELSTVSDEWLVDAVEPLAVACVAGIETRSDKAARWLKERGAGKRKAALPVRMEAYKHGHGRRVQLVERVEMAAARLIGGDSVDNAARAVGFKDRMHGGKLKEAAGVQLARAARAIGLNFSLVQPSNRPTVADEFNPYRRPLAVAGRTFAAGELWGASLTAGTDAAGFVVWS